MYISITPQKISEGYSKSSADFVNYLEKENEERSPEYAEQFFDQYQDKIDHKHVVREIDANTKKLRSRDPRFYSITISPSQRELRHLDNPDIQLKEYTRQLMEEYAKSFHRETEIRVENIKYYAKLEHERTYKGFDRQVRENAPYNKKIIHLRNEIRMVDRGEIPGSISKLEKEIHKLELAIPHKVNGIPIVEGMKKEGLQTHVHIIVSRKDISNQFSLSPGSKHKASEVQLNGKTVKRGFDRDKFFQNAEKAFDKTFGYDRNYVEKYHSHKIFSRDPQRYFSQLLGLPQTEKGMAIKLLRQTGIEVPNIHIPTNQVQMALQAIKQVKRAMEIAVRSSSIGI